MILKELACMTCGKDFALYEIEAKEKERRRWVRGHDLEKQGSTSNESELEESILIDGGWKELERISICGQDSLSNTTKKAPAKF